MKLYKYGAPEKPTIRIDDTEHGLQVWLADYERESRHLNTCRFIEHVGARHVTNVMVQLHDEITGANFRQPLA